MIGTRRFSSELSQKIKGAVNIIDVVGEHVVLRKSGTNYVGLCPFHSERTPSFNVSETKQLYHCYGCRKGGDLLSFVMEIHGLDFPEAIEELADRARIPLPSDWRGARGAGGTGSQDPEAVKRREEAREKLETAHRLNRFVAAFFHNQLVHTQQAMAYFQSRGISDSPQLGEGLLRSFYLGYAQPSWDSLASHLAAAKAPLPLAAELGLILPSTRNSGIAGTGYFDFFRNRAVFPILDLRGKVAGFGGRIMPRKESSAETQFGEGKGMPEEGAKYLNSRESLLFQKNRLAFGLFQAQKHIREKDEVILVEGYFDVLALHAAGFKNVVASCGTALSAEHLALFRKFASRVTLLFDGDRAGIAATERAMELGLANGMVLQGAVLPENLDPDQVLFDQRTGLPISGGREQMASFLSEAKPLIDVRLDQEIRSSEFGPEARTQALKRMGGWLSKFNDPVGKEVRIQYIQDRLSVPRNLLLQAMGSVGTGGVGRTDMPPRQNEPAIAINMTTNSKIVNSRPQRNSPSPIQRGGPRPGRGQRSLSRLEKVLLAGLCSGGKFASHWIKAGGNLPPAGEGVAELFDSAPAREFVTRIGVSVESLDHFKKNPGNFLEGVEDPQVRQILTEASLSEEGLVTEESFVGALDRATARSWARFSQRIRAALSEAEAKKDAGLQSQLMKEYLDVQRKMKEFISFYDEA